MEKIGKYPVRRRLGHGGFATAYLCVDPHLDSLVAVKVLSEHYASDEDIKARFENEAKILRKLSRNSDRILQVYTIDRLPDGRPYFVADYADRGTLASFLNARLKRSSNGGPFELVESVQLSRDIALCLDVAHRQQIVHRDLKPSNVLFKSVDPKRDEEATIAIDMEDVEAGRTKLILADFGIARALEAASGHSITAGTPQYMAPEQADGQADERSDLYAAAVVLYELVTGSTPYSGASLPEIIRRQVTESPPTTRDLRDDVPEFFDEMIVRGMAVDPGERFQSTKEWIAALDDAAERLLDGRTKPEDGKTIPDPDKWPPPWKEGDGDLPPGGQKQPPQDVWWKKPSVAVAGVALAAVAALLFFLFRPCTPAIPTGLVAAATTDGVQLTWDPVDEGCEVENLAVFRGGDEVSTVEASADGYLDSSADLSSANDYTLVAIGANRRESEPTDSVSSSALQAPPPPTNLEAVVESEAVELSWSAPSDTANLTGFGIYRDGELLRSVSGSTTTFRDNSVDTSTSHEYALDSIATDEIRSAPTAAVATSPFIATLEPFDRVDGSISVSGQTDIYEWEAEEDGFVTFRVDSDVAAPNVEVVAPDGNVIGESRGTNSVVLNLRPEVTGTHTATVNFPAEETGAYSIGYNVLTNCPIESTCPGDLDAGFQHEWFFAGSAGETVIISMLPDSATPKVELFAPDGSLVEENEGSSGRSIIVLRSELTQDGDYVVVASYPEGSGSYRMSIFPARNLQPQITIAGSLEGPGSELAQFHEFEGVEGTPFFAVMTSATGNPAIFLFDPTDEIIASNDDVDTNNTDAVIQQDLPVSGTYEIGVIFQEGSGEYRLRIDRDLPVDSVGRTENATIDVEGQVDTYTFEALEGETLAIFMASDSPNEEISLWDGSTQLDSATTGFIEYVIEESGFYELQATFSSGTGPYTVWFARFDPPE